MISPFWVAFFLFWADVMWLLQRKYHLPFHSMPLIITLAAEAIMYIGFGFVEVPIELRAILVRWSIVVVAFSMAFPLTLSYIFSRKPTWIGIL